MQNNIKTNDKVMEGGFCSEANSPSVSQKISNIYMKPEFSLPRSQKPVIDQYLKSGKFSPMLLRTKLQEFWIRRLLLSNHLKLGQCNLWGKKIT